MTPLYLFFMCLGGIYSWHNFSQFPKVRKCNMAMAMNQYQFGKEYFDFYREYKQDIVSSSERKLTESDYNLFIEKNIDSYLIFEKNYKKITQANRLLSSQNKTFVLDLNQYADVIDFDDEYTTTDLMINHIEKKNINNGAYFKFLQTPMTYIESFINQDKFLRFSWNDTGLLSPVKNQGQCGSCWAFSVTTALETFMRNNNYNVSRLSEQELVNCSPYDYGCNGGMMHTAFNYIIENGGLYTNDDFPYLGITENCTDQHNVSKAKGSQLHDYRFVIPKSIIDFKLSVLENPVAIALDADNLFFRFYSDGVIDLPSNMSQRLNHAVLLVGYDYDEGGEYWIIQNSWGKQWGINGFGKIRIQPDEGVLLCQSYGVYPYK